MNLKKYSSYFHDGNLINIEQKNLFIELSMESAELLPDWNEDNILLSNINTIKGKLHLEGVKSIKINSVLIDKLKMLYDCGDILSFKIFNDQTVVLLITWINFPPKSYTNDTEKIEIEAENIYWENIPDLEDE